MASRQVRPFGAFLGAVESRETAAKSELGLSLEIVKLLQGAREPLAIRQIVSTTGEPRTTVLAGLRQLERRGIITVRGEQEDQLIELRPQSVHAG